MTADPERRDEGAGRARGPTPAPPRPEIPGYVVDGVVGRGASGVVYRARQVAVDREVALKVLLPELSRNPRIVQRLKREARTTARLAHPNVITAIDMGEVDGRWWYAMELVEGGTLGQLVKRKGRLDERTALRLFIPLVEALVHLAEHGVVHRDIKPANVLIDERTGLARLADLGLAFADDDPERTVQASGTLGTPAFMSPEQAVDAAAADAQSDLWSLGATLFHALTGRPPFGGGSAAEVLTEVLHAPTPDPQVLAPELSTGLALVVRKCLTRDRDLRYRSATELLADLERIRERRAPRVRRSELVPSERERARRRAVTAIVAAVVCVAGAVFAVRAWPRGGVGEPSAPTSSSYAPLDRLEQRTSSERTALVGQHLRELDAVAAGAPAWTKERVATLGAVLRQELRGRVNELRRSVEAEVDAAREAGDYVEALALLDGVDARVLRATGVAREELEDYGVRLKTLSYLEAEVERGLESTLARLARDAQAFVTEARSRARRSFDRGDWTAAWEALALERSDLVRGAGMGDYRLPESRVEERLHPVEWELKLGRRRLVDSWTAIDLEFKRALDARADELVSELEEKASGVFDSVRVLMQFFEHELTRHSIVLEELPDAFHSQAAAGLGRLVERLREAEEARLEKDVRAEAALIERLARARLQRRDYAAVVELWLEVAKATEREVGTPDAGWRSRLGAEAERRAAAARRLEALLVRAAGEVLAADGRRVELYLGGIPRSGLLLAGVAPRKEGFRFVDERGGEHRFVLEELPARALERLVGWRRPKELDALDRLDLALFAFAEGEHERANDVLLSGPTPTEGLEGELVADLRIAVEAARARGEGLAQERGQEAAELLDRIFVAERWTHSPKAVLAEIDEVLERFGDLGAVRERREDLLERRAALRGDRQRATLEELQAAYPDATVTLPRPHRARLEFAFTTSDVPRPFVAGSWGHDGLARADLTPPASWEEFLRERGLRAVLTKPLVQSAEGFRLELDVRSLAAGGRERCLLVSFGGLHVGLVDGQLPGSTEFRPRWLVSDRPLDATVARLEEGGGQTVREVLPLDRPVQLVLEGSHAAGWVTIHVDGAELGTVRNLRDPGVEAPVLELRSWEPVRITGLAVEAGR